MNITNKLNNGVSLINTTRENSNEFWKGYKMSLDVCITAKVISSVFEANITHNLNTMAEEAGIYKALWRPDEIQIFNAGQLVPILEKGLKELKDNPDKYKKFNPENGWGDYFDLLDFIEKYLTACYAYPDGLISVDR